MIICPTCKKKTAVIDSRLQGDTVRRDRICKTCSYAVSTIEVQEDNKERVRINADPKSHGNILRYSKE